MTPDAIKNTLLPFLDTLTKREDDEVVFAIAEEYVNIAYLLCLIKAVIEQSARPRLTVFGKLVRSWWNSRSRESGEVNHKVAWLVFRKWHR